MSLLPVDVFLSDSGPGGLPISGATVSVYDATGTTPITQAVSDVTGQVALLLEDGGTGRTYQIRCFKPQVSFRNPTLIVVLPTPAVNKFDIKGSVFAPPVSPDSRFCVAYGFFRTAAGLPAKYVDIHFIPKFSPIVLEGSAVLTERVITRTDRNGYVEVPLIRYGQYDVMVQGIEDVTRIIAVPSQANVNLADLLFPVVGVVSFSPAGPFSVGVGVNVDITPQVFSTDGNELLGAAVEDVLWDTDNHQIAVVAPASGILTLRGVSPGTCNLIATRRDQSIVRIPDTPIAGVPIAITVA